VVIVDGGITKKGKKVLGDVDFESVRNKADFLTPVPGGVGPVTIACLLRNTCEAAKKSR
jgi:methylenetetrahydrofolate dehydrogenase (NADP+)/methenyltetrahydrofolate cyclohydrolase